MGAEQTLTSRNSQENVTSNNALSINDSSSHGLSLQRKANVANNTGLPDSLKRGVETLSGYSLNDVRVHYNSSKPAAVQAYAYTQGTDIHIAPGQERCLPHEAWHVTQQMSGRVSPTTSIGGVAVNDDASLEHEADVMGARASTLQGNNYAPVSRKAWSGSSVRQNKSLTIQREGAGEGPLCEAPNMSVAVGDAAQSKALKDDVKCIEEFKNKEYVKEDHKVGKNGHFNVVYAPSNKRLDISLPVFYGSNFGGQDSSERTRKKVFFRDNIKNTWSNKYHIKCRRTRPELETPPSKNWESELNDTTVDVNVVEKSDRDEAFFNLETIPFGVSYVQGSEVRLSEKSFMDIKKPEDRETYEKDGERYTILSWNPTAHEAGHMLGLGDEYGFGNDEGTPSTHYNLTKEAFGKPYADAHAVRQDKDSPQDSSIMDAGGKVEKHHYVTFWDAMVQAIQTKYPLVPSSEAPNTRGDWKIE